MQVNLIIVMLYGHKSHIRLNRDGERGGGVWSGTYEQLVPALRPVKTEETVGYCQNNMLRRWGPRQCEAACVLRSLLFHQLCGTKSQRQSLKHQPLGPETKDSPAHYENLALSHSSDHSWAMCT